MLRISEAWRVAYPDAHAGILVMQGVSNPAAHPELERLKQGLESQLRAQFAGRDRSALDNFSAIPAYTAYYKQFKKTYPVQAQLESIAFKGKSLPSVAALVETMFMAEIRNLLLTAGHDFDRLQLPVTLDVASGDEGYTLLRGQEQTLKAGDMFMVDQAGVISSIVYGPDQRTQIGPQTRNALFAVYAPEGIEPATFRLTSRTSATYVLVLSHLKRVQTLQVFGAGPT
jgi:DNA/RNA-binding domain of Phe-tRNA-synthetase-like protein